MYLSCLICIYMYTHVYMFIPMLYLYVHMCTDIYMYVHICIHWHVYSFFVCTYKSIQRVIFWMTNKSISCDTNEISCRVASFYQTHESNLFCSPYLFDHVSKHSGPVPPRHGIRYYGSTRHSRWCTITRRWDQVQTQVHTNVHLSGRISEYGMIYIDIYAYIYTYRYIYIYRYI